MAGYSYSGSSLSPKLAFAHPESGIQFFGGGKSKFEKFEFKKSDLLINLTGYTITIKPPSPFVKSTPDFLKSLKKDNKDEVLKTEDINQLILDWPDMKAPPSNVGLDFWQNIYEMSVQNNIERILICCTAGQGRTGTALSSFLLALGIEDCPLDAMDFIRDEYSKHAIEKSCQEEYVCNLVEDFDMADYDQWDGKTSSTVYTGTTYYKGGYNSKNKSSKESKSMVVHKSSKSGSKMGPYKNKKSKSKNSLGADIESEIWMAWEKYSEDNLLDKYDMEKYDEYRDFLVKEKYSFEDDFVVTKSLDCIKFDSSNTPEDWENFFKDNDYILKVSPDNDPAKSTITYDRRKISM